jgi:dimethylargininase
VDVIAIVRGVAGSLATGLSAVPPDPPVDVARARAQHASYVTALRAAGRTIEALPADEAFPDCCFVEDPAVVAGGIALLTRPGAPARQGEPAGVHEALARHVDAVETMDAPATLDGGDCCRLGRTLYIGRTARTNAAGAARAAEVFARVGVGVVEVPVSAALHLKSVCSPIAEDTLLVAEGALDVGFFAGARIITVPAIEAPAANAVVAGEHLLVAAGFPRTREKLEKAGFACAEVDTSELRKLDGALTCLSILIP